MHDMVILIDTNILLDFLQQREPFRINAVRIIQKNIDKEIAGYIAAHSITNAFYILQKDYSADERKAMLLDLCRTLTVIGIDYEKLIRSLMDDNFDDIEDYLQAECAVSIGADYIVTRNMDDFTNSPIPAILPEDFLEKLVTAHD
jgi:predicted nucleic-acid-binding protein